MSEENEFTLDQVFNILEANITPEKVEKMDKASFLFDIGGELFLADFGREAAPYIERVPEAVDAKCVIAISKQENWFKLVNGQLNPASAFMTGKLKVKGNMALAMKLQKIID